MALKMLIEQDTPFASGAYRNIDIIVPPATVCSATPPDAPAEAFDLARERALLPMDAAIYARSRPMGGGG